MRDIANDQTDKASPQQSDEAAPEAAPDATLHAIRSVLAEAFPRDTATAHAGPHDTAAERSATAKVTKKATEEHPNAPSGALSKALTKALSKAPRLPLRDMGDVKTPALTAVKGYRPTPKHLALGVFAAILVFRPAWVLLVLLIAAVGTLGAFACLGADRVWGAVTRLFKAFAARRPAQAARLAAQFDAFAMRWDSILDRFPEGTVDSLYLPDFQAMQARDDAHTEAVNARLERLQQEG